MVIWENTFLVEREYSWNVQFSIYNTISQEIFHHFLFWRFSVGTSNEVAFFDLSYWLAFAIFSALISFGFGKIWSTFFWNKITIFCEISVEEWPSTITSLSQIIACHQILWREYWLFLSISKLKSWLYNLCKRDSIAWTASTLISQRVGEIKTINISIIIWIWYQIIWNFISCFIVIVPTLSFC